MHSFQLKLLQEEKIRAEKGRKVFKDKLERDRSTFREKVRPNICHPLFAALGMKRGITPQWFEKVFLENLINCQTVRIDQCGMAPIVKL